MADLINVIRDWLYNLMISWGASQDLAGFVLQVLGSILVVILCFVIVIALIWVERKLAGRIQDRFGQNRAGPFGIFQSFADIIKIFTKEYVTPTGADKSLFNIAPVLAMASVLAIWAVFPFAINVIGADVNVGVLYIVAIGSFGILAILMAGWSSNNRYALLGASRSVAMLISYEIPMVISLLIPVLLTKSMQLSAIIEAQRPWWFLIVAPTAALFFLISSMAEIGKAPFDLLEAESELVAGFMVEYSSTPYLLFMLGEYVAIVTMCSLATILFLGGWLPPLDIWPLNAVPGIFWFIAKATFMFFMFAMVKAMVPRYRYDQLMRLGWKVMLPLGLANMAVTALVVALIPGAKG